MKERKLGLAKRLSAFALAFVMVFSLLATFNVSALAADDNAPILNDGWTYDGEAQDLILVPGESDDPDYAMYYYMTTDEDEEPLAPSKTNMRDWTRNWRDDEQFVATNAGKYYVWYCTFNAEENDVDVEPTCAGVVEVEKATIGVVAPVANSRTVSYKRLNTVDPTFHLPGVSLLQENTGFVMADYASFATLDWAITGTDTTSMTEADLNQDTKNLPLWGNPAAWKNEAGKYRVWYQAKVFDAEYEDNYEDGDIEYVDVTITEGDETLVVDPAAISQKSPCKGTAVADAQSLQDIANGQIYNATTGEVVANATVTYGAKRSEINAGSAAATGVTATTAGSSATVWYKVEADGYNDLVGTMTLTITKAQATATWNGTVDTTTADVVDVQNGNTAVAPTAGTATFKAMATTSASKPSTSDSKWTAKDASTNTLNIASQLKENKINYVYYMAKANDTKNIADSDISYCAYYATAVTNQATGVKTWTLTPLTRGGQVGTTNPIAVNWTAPTANGAQVYDGTRKPLLATLGSADTGATIQYNVKYTDNLRTVSTATLDNTMPAASDSGWFAATSPAADKLNATAVGTYEVWYRVTFTYEGVTYQSTPALVNGAPSTITPGTFATGVTSPESTGPLYWTGKNQALFTAGKVEDKPGLSWLYVTTKVVDNEDVIVGFGTSPIKAADADTYTTKAFLLDSNYNYNTNVAFAQATRMVNNYGIKGQVVNVVPIQTVINQGEPNVTAPTLTKEELTYDGEPQSLLATSGKTDLANIYQVVTDEKGRLVSLDGTATDAGAYTVSYLVTDESPVTLLMFDTAYGWDSALRANLERQANVWDMSAVGSVEIDKAKPTVTGVEPTSNEATGYDLELCTYGTTDGGKIYYQAKNEKNTVIFSDAEGWRIVPEASEMGEYTISYKVVGDKNFKDVDWVTLTDKAQIAAGKAEVTTAPVGLGYNANGDALVLATAGEAEDGHMEYALGTMLEPVTDWSDEIPTATEEGTYYVWYKAKGDEGFADSDKDFVVATIGHETVLYRIFNPASGEHIYTYDEAEVANATQNLGWTLDGTVSGTSEGTIPVYRLENLVNPGVHIYSTDENEIATLVDAGVAKLEGVQFYTVPQGEGTEDYYRLSSPSFPHHYTADQNEINSLIASGVYTLDGYAWSFPGTSN